MRHAGHQGVTYRVLTDLVLIPSKALATSWPNGLLLSRLKRDDMSLIIPSCHYLLLKTYNALRHTRAEKRRKGSRREEGGRRKRGREKGGKGEKEEEGGGGRGEKGGGGREKKAGEGKEGREEGKKGGEGEGRGKEKDKG